MLKNILSLIGIIAITAGIAYYAGYKQLISLTDPAVNLPSTKLLGPHYYELEEPEGTLHFDLVDPELAPAEIHEKVMYGFKIMCETTTYAKEFVVGRINCTNCHFAAGNTFGGPGGGISLVGVVNTYPSYSKRDKKMINLKDRLNNCFMRSMDGKRVPDNHPIMEALVAYLEWISKPVATVKNPPWLGLPDITVKHTPDPLHGRTIYEQKCATCHGYDGDGQVAKLIPPLWGNGAYNDGAGMNHLG